MKALKLKAVSFIFILLAVPFLFFPSVKEVYAADIIQGGTMEYREADPFGGGLNTWKK